MERILNNKEFITFENMVLCESALYGVQLPAAVKLSIGQSYEGPNSILVDKFVLSQDDLECIYEDILKDDMRPALFGNRQTLMDYILDLGDSMRPAYIIGFNKDYEVYFDDIFGMDSKFNVIGGTLLSEFNLQNYGADTYMLVVNSRSENEVDLHLFSYHTCEHAVPKVPSGPNKYISDIANATSQSMILTQLAEECNELAKAALKINRYISGDVFVKPVDELITDLAEELADVKLCTQVLYEKFPVSGLKKETANQTIKKRERWHNRVMHTDDEPTLKSVDVCDSPHSGRFAWGVAEGCECGE